MNRRLIEAEGIPFPCPPMGGSFVCFVKARQVHAPGRAFRSRADDKRKRKGACHGKAQDSRHEERHGPRARMPTGLRPDGDDVWTRGLRHRERGEEPHALERQGLRAHERGLRTLRDAPEDLPERRREEDAVQAPEEALRDVRFFRDPCNSRQKPHVERSHEGIRRALVKDSSFDALTQIVPNSGAAVPPARGLRPGGRTADVMSDLSAARATTRAGQCRESRARRIHEFARSAGRAARTKPITHGCRPSRNAKTSLPAKLSFSLSKFRLLWQTTNFLRLRAWQCVCNARHGPRPHSRAHAFRTRSSRRDAQTQGRHGNPRRPPSDFAEAPFSRPSDEPCLP